MVYDEESQKVVATLTNNATGQAIKGFTIHIKLHGESYSLVTDANGQVSVSTADLTPGTIYTVTATFNGGTKYNAAKATEKIAIVANTTLSVDYDDDAKEVTVTLTNDATGDAIKGFTVNVKLHGETYKLVTDENGQVKVSTADLTKGVVYTVTATFNGGTKYNAAKVTESIAVKANTTIALVYDEEAQEIVATLTNNATGVAIQGYSLHIRMNGETFKLVTDENGQVKVSTADLAP